MTVESNFFPPKSILKSMWKIPGDVLKITKTIRQGKRDCWKYLAQFGRGPRRKTGMLQQRKET